MVEHLTSKKADIAEVLCNLVKKQSVPDVGLDVFDGNPLEYNPTPFHQFHELVEKRTEYQTERPTYLEN